MEKKWKVLNTKAIINNLNLVFRTREIDKLNNPTYEFVMNLSGFIAHYDLNGFKAHYHDLRDLIKDLKECSDVLRPDYCLECDFQKDYYKSKSETLKGILPLVLRYELEINKDFSNLEKDQDINTIKVLMRKHNLKWVKLKGVKLK